MKAFYVLIICSLFACGCGNYGNSIDVGIVVNVNSLPGDMSGITTDKGSAIMVKGDATTDIKKGDRVKVKQVNGKDDTLYKNSFFAKSYRILKRWN